MLITRILKPHEFNSVTLAELLWERHSSPDVYEYLQKSQRVELIEEAQWVLDEMQKRGIIG